MSPPAGLYADDAQRTAKAGAEQIRDEARELKDSAKQTASQAAGQLKDTARQATAQASQTAAQLTQQAKEKGAAFIDEQKGRAVGVIADCVSATRRAAQKLHDENDHNLAGYADALAERLDSVGNYLNARQGNQLVHDVADLARRRPEWVLGGAFVLGLAAARFLKASRPGGAAYGTYRYGSPQPSAGGYGYGYTFGESGRGEEGSGSRHFGAGNAGTGTGGYYPTTYPAAPTAYTTTPAGGFGETAGQGGTVGTFGAAPTPSAPTSETGTAACPPGLSTIVGTIAATQSGGTSGSGSTGTGTGGGTGTGTGSTGTQGLSGASDLDREVH